MTQKSKDFYQTEQLDKTMEELREEYELKSVLLIVGDEDNIAAGAVGSSYQIAQGIAEVLQKLPKVEMLVASLMMEHIKNRIASKGGTEEHQLVYVDELMEALKS